MDDTGGLSCLIVIVFRPVFIQIEDAPTQLSATQTVFRVLITFVAVGVIAYGKLQFKFTGYRPPKKAFFSDSAPDREIARWKIAFYAFPLILIYAYWVALPADAPMAPVLVGTTMNLIFTYSNFVVIKHKIAKQMEAVKTNQVPSGGA